MTLLDTSVLIAHHRGDHGVRDAVNAIEDVRRIAAQTWVEFLVGIDGRRSARVVKALQAALHFVPFDRPVAGAAIALQRRLLADGKRLGWPDLQIAATAIHVREPLMTRDSGFLDVPGIEVKLV